jgi:hypothetical protein
MAAMARPIPTSVGSARRPAVSLMTGVAATEVPATAGLPGTDEQSRRSSAPEVPVTAGRPGTDEQSRRSSATEVARPGTSPVAAIAEVAAARDGEEITHQEPCNL